MVKGVARHAVIVRPQEGREFEQAIFILSDGGEAPVRSPEELLSLAGELANKYAVPAAPARRGGRRRLAEALRAAGYFLCGSGATALVWWFLERGGL